MVFPLLLLLAAQTPAAERAPIAVVLTSHRHGAEAVAPRVATRVLETCRREGLELPFDLAETVKDFNAAGVSDPRSCNGTRACLAGLAVVLGPRAVVVGVDVAVVAQQVSVHLEAMQAGSSAPLASAELLAPVETWADLTLAGITRFARQLKDRLPARPEAIVEARPALPVDSPVKAAAAPSLTPTTVTLAEVPPLHGAPPARTAATVTAIGGGVALAGAVVLLLSGLADRSTYGAGLFTATDGALATRLAEPEALALAANANGKVAGAVVATIAGAALGAVSAYLFTRPAELATRADSTR